MRRLLVIGASLLATTASCRHEKIALLDDRPDELDGLTALRIDPESAAVTNDGARPGPEATFTAWGRFEDGAERDVSASVTWTLSDPALGGIDDGRVRLEPTAGGTVMVRAAYDTFVAEAPLTVHLDVRRIQPNVPPNAVAAFREDTTGDVQDPGLGLIYPASDTVFPANVRGVRIQWDAAVDDATYEVRIDSATTRLRWYTREPELDVEAEDARRWVFAANAGHTVTVVIRAVEDGAPMVVRRFAPLAFEVSTAALPGAAYFWSSTAGAIERATLDTRRAVKLDLPESGCVGCHAISSSGTRVAYAVGGERLAVYDFEHQKQIFPLEPDGQEDFEWASFSPDATRLVTSRRGKLKTIELDTGRSDEHEVSDDLEATQPVWSPTGEFLVAAVKGGENVGAKRLSGTSIARIAISDDELGEPRILAASRDSDDTLFAPSISPDGRWVAFARTRGPSKDATDGEVWVVDATGVAPAFRLARTGVASYPTWARSDEAGTYWLAFSSARAYGRISPEGARDQLWVTCVDVARLSAGADPSSPAFWWPRQDPTEDNHRAFFVAGDSCLSSAAVCAPDVCASDAEICGGGDEDCDGAVDEGCGCARVEVCDNDVDDDCDLLNDERDEDCRES